MQAEGPPFQKAAVTISGVSIAAAFEQKLHTLDVSGPRQLAKLSTCFQIVPAQLAAQVPEGFGDLRVALAN